MKTTVTKLLATVAAASTIFGMSTLPAFAAEGKSASNGNSVNISDVNATAETRALFDKLKNSGKGDLRFGQQHTTDENISSSASQGDVYEMTGKYPAVFGWDAGLALRGAEKPGSGADKNANAKALAQNITDADSKGAIVTLSAHWCSPGTGKDFNDTTAVASELLPGGKYSGTFNKELDAIAATAQQAKHSDGTLIPIIFRPLHENNGSWFWWGATHASASEYKELYRYIVDYLRDVKDVHNLLYAYSPGGVFNGDSTDYLATYPGDQWVDVLGYDEYDSDDSADDSSAWINTVVKDMKMVSDQASQRGKIVALTEFGRSGDRKFKESGTGDKDTKFFSELAEALAENVPSTAYMMTWANFGGGGDNFQAYTPWKGSDGEADFKAFADSNKNLMASKDNVDYSNAPAAAMQNGSARIVTPVDGNRVTDTKVVVRVKTEGVKYSDLDLNSAILTTDRGQNVKLKYSCNGYFTGILDLNAAGINLDQSKLTLTPQVKTKDGKTLAAADGNGGDFAPASWDTAHAGMKLSQKLLSKVGSFALYINDNGGNRPKSGDLTLDSIKLDGKRDAYAPNTNPTPGNTAKAQSVDDFSGYSDDAAAQSAWGNRGHTEVLSLDEGPTDGSKALRFKYDFSNGGWYDVAKYLDGANWSGESVLAFQVKGDGSDHAIGLQIGTSDGKYFLASVKLDFTGWKQIEIPLVDNANLTQSWPEDANKDNPMTEDDLASIKELVFASQQWNSESDGLDFSIADIKVEPAENTSNEQTPKDESKTEVKADKEQEQSEDTSADVTAQDPATCPISDEDSKGSTGNTTVTVKPTPDTKEPADNTGKDGLSRTGSNIISAIAAVAVLLLGGCAVLIARKRKGGDIE